jgi:hypothetical protein
MAGGQEYLENAIRCVAQARQLPEGFLKRGLVAMSEMWLNLMEQAIKRDNRTPLSDRRTVSAT